MIADVVVVDIRQAAIVGIATVQAVVAAIENLPVSACSHHPSNTLRVEFYSAAAPLSRNTRARIRQAVL